jgi:hypothetical protein
MRPVETISRMGMGGIKENGGGDEKNSVSFYLCMLLVYLKLWVFKEQQWHHCY